MKITKDFRDNKIRDYCEQLYINKFNNLHEMHKFVEKHLTKTNKKKKKEKSEYSFIYF